MKTLFLPIFAALLSAPDALAAVNITTTFSSAEGYIAGGIDDDDNSGNQSDDWQRVNSATSNSFIVGPPGVTVNEIASGSAQAVYQTAIDFSQGAVTTSVDFVFSRNGAIPTINQTVIGMAYLNNGTAGNYSNFSSLFGLTASGYRIAWSASSDTAITDAELGLDLGASDFTSDSLRLSMTVTRLGADTFSRALSLTNLNTNTVIASFAPASFTDATVYADNTVYSSFHSSFNNNATEVEGLSISQFGIVQVPEPGSLLLVCAGSLLSFRRRR